MKKLTAIVLTLALLLSLAACGYVPQSELDDAKAQIETLNQQITAKEAKITTLESEKAALAAEKAELEGEITSLEAEKKTLEDEKVTLESEVSTLEGEKKTLSDKAEALDADIKELNGKVAALEASGDADEAEIAKLKEDIAALADEKAAVDGQVTALEGTITEKNSEIAALNSSLSALETEKAALTASVANLETSIAAKETEITNLNSSIETLTAEKQTLSDRITALEKEKETLENEKTELEKENEALRNCLKNGHDYTYTDNGDGTHDSVCSVCGYVKADNENHNFDAENYDCICGAIETVDVNLADLTATYVINDSRWYHFTGSGNYGIKVESGNPRIVLNNANITVGEGSAIAVASSSNATIFVQDDNSLSTTAQYLGTTAGGIFVAEGGTVNITSNSTNNTLRVTGNTAAAIGGKYVYAGESYNAGNINISNVTVYAYTNNYYAAAIGAAGVGTCGTINITNAVVYAYGAGDKWTSAPGIGNAWSLVGWPETIPVVIISDSELHTFRYNSASDYIGYLGDVDGNVDGSTFATGSINCGEGGSVKSSTIYCYTGLDATTTDKVVTYNAEGTATEN
ncbi:MAG: hypothetical protein IJD63_00750 [Oscillospiraceae bacterium]|nr:hypothetical protein [Oscillospiraceae bacterium]